MTAIDDQARNIFLAALERESDYWPVYLNEACGSDAELRARVEQLLHAHQALGSIHNGGIVGAPIGGLMSERPGTIVGSYRLLEQIGEGGFGVVFMAEQTQPVRRKVALKVLKPGMDTRQVVARFEAERQALALMDHSNIAKVLDGGVTSSGRPYFVMELVNGMPITDYCDQNNLSPRQRMELFVPVCHAVQHAHQKGIIHRDLKPSNILVTRHDDTPVVKVIDFGVAKALGQSLTDKTLLTGNAQMIGTPLYMSPEQAGMSELDIDTRSDIYSLGVLMYELLTGTTPFTRERFRQAAFDEIRRIIREEEPPKPSTRLSESKDSLPSISAQRDTEPQRLTKLVRGELDWIVMKALDKDRNQRYETANGFAMDVQRYLADEPVAACPPSAAYRFRKFARRHKAGLAIATTMVVAGLLAMAGLAANNWLVTREKKEKEIALDRAVREKERADQNLARARQAVKEYLLKTSDSVELRAADFHDLRRQLLETAIPFYMQFVRESQDDPGLDVERAQAHYDLGKLRQETGDLERALTDLAEVENIYRRLVQAGAAKSEIRQRLAETHNTRAGVLQQLGRLDEADRSYRESHDSLDALAAENPSTAEYRDSLARACSNWGELLTRLSRPRDAEALLRRSVALREALLLEKPDDAVQRVQLATSWTNLGGALSGQRKTSDAEQAFQKAADLLDPELMSKLGVSADVVPRWQKSRGYAFNNLAAMRQATGRLAEAADAIRVAVEIKEQLADRFPSVPQYRLELAGSFNNLGTILKDLGKPAESRAAYEKAVGGLERLVAGSPAVPTYAVSLAGTYVNVGRLIGDTGELDPSLPWLTKAVDLLESHYRRDSRVAKVRESLVTACWTRAMTLAGLERYQQALADWDRAIDLDDDRYFTKLRVKRASNLLQLKNHVLATKDAQAISASAKATPEELYLAACIFAASVPMTVGDDALGDSYGNRAVAMLQQAWTRGYKNYAGIQKDSSLDPVRKREDFQRLLKHLGTEAKTPDSAQPSN